MTRVTRVEQTYQADYDPNRPRNKDVNANKTGSGNPQESHPSRLDNDTVDISEETNRLLTEQKGEANE